ncbi:MAG: 6-bladed beta-propeller [bacterium]|nr:6-bladed beta-propeller [bacterium]
MTAVTRCAILIMLLHILIFPVAAAPWQGDVKYDGSIPIVLNPAEPMRDHRDIKLRELWRLGGESTAEQDLFGMVEQVRLDSQGNVYILDVQLHKISVFSPSGEFLRNIGQEGEGPGDFRNAIDFFILSDDRIGVIQMLPARIAMMTTEGDGLADMFLPGSHDDTMMYSIHEAQTMDDLLLFSWTETTFAENDQVAVEGLVACDLDGSVSGVWKQISENVNRGGGTIVLNPDSDMEFVGNWTLAPDHHSYLAPWYSGYRIEVLNDQGKTVRFIEREYEPVKRNRDDIKAIEDRYSDTWIEGRKTKVEYNPFRRDIVSLAARSNGELWVLSSRGEEQRAKDTVGRYDVFDDAGHFSHTMSILLSHDPAYDEVQIRGDRLFLLKEVNNGPRVLISNTAAGSIATVLPGKREQDDEDEEREAQLFELICYELLD